jgi:hypothetical protein
VKLKVAGDTSQLSPTYAGIAKSTRARRAQRLDPKIITPMTSLRQTTMIITLYELFILLRFSWPIDTFAKSRSQKNSGYTIAVSALHVLRYPLLRLDIHIGGNPLSRYAIAMICAACLEEYSILILSL